MVFERREERLRVQIAWYEDGTLGCKFSHF